MSRELRFALAVVVAGMAARAHAAVPYLVKDINPTPHSADARPGNFAAFAGRAVFAAERDGDRELWSSDGTEAGTVQLADVCAGDCLSDPRLLASTPIGAFYLMAQGSSERELWLTRGVAGDPVRLAAGLFAPEVIRAAFVPQLQRVFFSAITVAHGRELWSSDGTAAGTRLVDIRPGPLSSAPTGLVAFKGKLFFFANDGKGYALWTSDGTAGGTRLVKRPTATGNLLGPLVALDRSLVFFAGTAGKGSELWRSDGTPAGTNFFAETVKGPGSPTVLSYQALPSKLYLALETPNVGQELWVTDGTPKGTRSLTAFARRDAFMYESTPLYLFPGSLGGRFVFSADDGSHGAEPWITDGTVKGTRLLSDICPGACGSLSWIVGQAGERLLINATDGGRGFELWSTDGTTAGTRLVGDLCPGDCSSFPLGYGAVGGRQLFLAHPADGSTDNTFELWASDGTLAGTERLTDFDDDQLFLAFESVVIGTRMFFSAPDPQHGHELWASDGTLAGTHLVRDIADEDLGGSFPAAFQAAGSRLYFAADDGNGESWQLWRTDGTEQGTLRIDDAYGLRPPFFDVFSAAIGTDLVFTRGSGDGAAVWRTDGTAQGTIQLSPSMRRVYSMVAVGGTVFFSVRDQDFVPALWKTDGTPAGTQEVVQFSGGYDGWQADELTPFGNGVIFRAGSSGHGIEPWRSDGTAAGTSLISDLELGEGYHTLYGFQTIGGVAYFLGPGAPGLLGVGLWRTDGTAAGTVQVVQLGGSFDDRGPSWIAQLGAQLVVFVRNGLWATDGTQAGTHQISTASRYYLQPASEGPAVFGGRVYFGAIDSVSQRHLLFVSDGTAAGTAPMLDAEGLPIENPSAVRDFGGRLTFAAAHGGESALWQSDGTPAGTAPIFSLGPAFFAPHEMAVAGSRLYFSARDREHGEELWALPAEP